ncbi:hypothetical protein T484DRAFT_2023433 [Baffinella frigidus]|nr:hypothetical protein T484DRAFT_2023433 [Cryptophyta sp. CCMP2293]|mmetsp:Transcript_28481/g.67998  ORF Transcript_28481/g.67998 Transcript_28481/m.67998 type:complete len:304 (-) Transcript_28481:112-1023(-)|eukprot:CAMPEP_0180195526 /NCGR_PEP_ID=MMETSP0987-20121128/3624_1 /TAXON_ID=697907 /ORGANISM="non described non described, Strain CCMP2293" /LENGTH=303 /DNA_ID=CAMNT_0022150353 /DNA_START=51 /DNA_END=962 /DNA_ORIENTATION=-
MADVSQTWLSSLLGIKPEPAKNTAGYGSMSPGDLEAAEKAPVPEPWHDAWGKKIVAKLPKTVDTLLAAVGLACTMIAMLFFETFSGFRLFSLSMSASGIIFFAPSSPPQLQGFFVGTLVGATISWTFFSLLPYEVALGLAAGTVLLSFKTFNVIFPPSAALGVLIAQEMNVHPGDESRVLSLAGWITSTTFVLSPWLVGHLILFCVAYAVSQLRKVVRRHMVKGQLAGLGAQGNRAELIKTFEKFDTSGDGFLDAEELRIALRAVGNDVSLDDCHEMIGTIDADGDGVISCAEFISLHEDNLI